MEQKDVVERITSIEAAFSEAKVKTGYDNWQVNAAVHFNEWADLKKEDFGPVVAAFREFTNSYACDACGESIQSHRNAARRKRCVADVAN
ncbi:hypothetical protein ATN84_21550 [Paramesorhizobium deserti]|uniref:Uncharacterized protein n=1 Tax=Paramesorhizobium deserti TaxID=1494590 RepID=A0A135HNS8_9HYPH|nr:hypothetical protein [Paramesorhizobium deserti]KXF74820.1 hypothetical protein ATN84_21550 [Paramesorhizobium deserti]